MKTLRCSPNRYSSIQVFSSLHGLGEGNVQPYNSNIYIITIIRNFLLFLPRFISSEYLNTLNTLETFLSYRTLHVLK